MNETPNFDILIVDDTPVNIHLLAEALYSHEKCPERGKKKLRVE